ncbi:MAG: hypothetical protein ABTD50_00835 [Polyangiaceae bacterium]
MGSRTVVPVLQVSPAGAARMFRARMLASTRPQTAVAIRIPERTGTQLRLVLPTAAPRLFVHEGARQALDRRLRSAFVGPVILWITDNRHSIITHRVVHGVLHVRAHHMFLDAPPSVMDALARYIVRGDREASALLGDYIDENGFRLARRKRNVPLVTKGQHHDLLEIYHKVSDQYFGGSMSALITWGKRPTTRNACRRTIKLGSYSAFDRLIRIHPTLDQRWIPRYFVAYVVYHEMLHQVVPGSRGLGRVNLHPPEFKERERAFRQYERAITWERAHIDRLLRS